MNWTETLLNWYNKNRRNFNWRKTNDPYKIWLSEIILQQTRASQGTPYYDMFIKTFPTVKTLALASEDKVLKLWQGLGYYSRARNLHASAKYIYFNCNGKFPSSFNELLNLKGVGDYTASAIASICFDLPEAVVDGNVYRFLSRYFGITTPINSSVAHREFKEKATRLMDFKQPGTFNQALMEFGALQCVPRNPLCSICPYVKKCVAFKNKKTHLLPIKKSKINIKNRFFNYLFIQDKERKILVERRKKKDIWQNLFQFPLIETPNLLNEKKALLEQIEPYKGLNLNIDKLRLWNKTPLIHKLSHQKLYVFFWLVNSSKSLHKAVKIEELKKLAVPVVLENFIDNFLLLMDDP